MARSKRHDKARTATKPHQAEYATNLQRGERDEEMSPASDVDLKDHHIDPQDQALIGKSWSDRDENGAKFVLKSVEWSRVNSRDGTGAPLLIGSYDEVGVSSKKYWFEMKVIREWIRNEANYEACNVSDAFTDKKNGKVSKLAKHGDDIESWGQHESTHFTKASMRNGATKPANQRTRKMTQRGCLAALQVEILNELTINNMTTAAHGHVYRILSSTYMSTA